jgi:mannose/fructose/N-acetylgalactosamine-specific phosphotransferase system component IID
MMFFVFLKTLFINTFINEKNLQNLGMVYAMSSVLKRTAKTAEDYYSRLMKYFEYFYSNSFFISTVIGLCVNLEQKEKTDIISKIKTESMAPIAALSDSLVWGTLKPLLTVIFGSLAVVGYPAGAVGFWVLFFSITNYFRIWNLVMSSSLGLAFVYRLIRLNLQEIITLMKQVLVTWFGGFAVILLAMGMSFPHGLAGNPTAIFVLAFFLANTFIFGRMKNIFSFIIFVGAFTIYYFLKGPGI